MSEIQNKGYEIRVIKSAKNAAHVVTEPQIVKGDTTGKNKYYTLQLQAQKQMINGVMSRPQKRTIVYNVFNSSDQQILFNDIQDVLADEANYIKNADGAVTIRPEAMGIIGKMVDVPLDFVYDLMNKVNGKPEPFMITKTNPDGSTEQVKATRNFLRFFLHEEEDLEVRTMQEIKKVKPYGHFATANGEEHDGIASGNAPDDSKLNVA